MKTTLDIPETTIADAMRYSGAKTKRAAVIEAIEDYNRRAAMKNLARTLGTSDSFMTPGELATLRKSELPDDAR